MSIVSTGVGDHPVIRCTGSCELSRGALYVSAPKHFFWRGQLHCHRHAVIDTLCQSPEGHNTVAALSEMRPV